MQFGGTGQTPLREDFSYTTRDQVATQYRFSNLAGTTTIGYSTMTYDGVGRMTNLQHQNGSGANIANMTNSYDLASRITAEQLNGAHESRRLLPQSCHQRGHCHPGGWRSGLRRRADMRGRFQIRR